MSVTTIEAKVAKAQAPKKTPTKTPSKRPASVRPLIKKINVIDTQYGSKQKIFNVKESILLEKKEVHL